MLLKRIKKTAAILVAAVLMSGITLNVMASEHVPAEPLSQSNVAPSPVQIIHAQTYNDKSGNIITEKNLAPDGESIRSNGIGNWVKYSSVDFGNGSFDYMMAVLSSSGGKSVDIRIDSPNGKLIGTLNLSATGGVYKEQYASISPVFEKHDVYLVFSDSADVSISWFVFGKNPDKETEAGKTERMKWFQDARFGQFIHWGAYSVLAGTYNGVRTSGDSEWIMSNMRIPKDDYLAQAVQPLNPTQYNAKDWVDLMKKAGQQYVVITSKHHDGFSMFDTQVNHFKDWSIVNTSAYGKDPMLELSKEAKKQGIKFGFYYSIMDWSHPSQDNTGQFSNNMKPGMKDQYVSEMKAQLRELIEKYDPALLWFDGEWNSWWTKQDGRDLYKYLRTIKNDLVINNRVGKKEEDDGDYGTPERTIPANGLPYPWETCQTIADSWGYRSWDSYKSAKTLVTELVSTSSKGGNYLLNIGPMANGLIPDQSIDRLTAVGKWLDAFGESIYGTKPNVFSSKPSWGYVTTKPGKVYLHVMDWPTNGKLEVPKLANRINHVNLLNKPDGSLSYTMKADDLEISVPTSAPNDIDSVIVIDVAGDPQGFPSPFASLPDLALNKTASANVQYSSSYSAAKAVDGDPGTRWAAPDAIRPDGWWLEVNFGSQTTFNSLMIDEWFDDDDHMPRITNYKIQYDDGGQWKDAYTGTTIGAGKMIMLDQPVTSSKVRLYILSVRTQPVRGPTINDLKVYNYQGASPDLALNKPASANTQWSSSYSAAKAVDGDPGTRWATPDENRPDGWWLEVNLGSQTTFNSLLIDEWYDDDAHVPRVTSYKIQYDDGGQWKDAYTGTTIGSGKVITLEQPVTSSKVRLHILTVRTEPLHGPTINDFKVFNYQASSIKPVITILGDKTVKIVAGDTYTDAGATAIDYKYGDISDQLSVNPAALDTSNPGIYTVTYNVKNEEGTSALEASRKVIVAPKAVTITSGSGTITVRNAMDTARLKLYNRSNQVVDEHDASQSLQFTSVPAAAGYYVTQTVNGIESSPSNIVQVGDSQSVGATLTGPASVISGQPLSLTFGLSSVSEAIYAEDVTFTYDPLKADFVSVETLHEGLQIIDKKAGDGQIRILAASLGGAHAVSGDGDLLKLNFLTKPVSEKASAETSFALTKAVIAASDGKETELQAITHNVTITHVDKSALVDLIASAQRTHDAATEGGSTGQYPAGSKAKLQEAINQAQTVANNTAATEQQVQQAAGDLNAALQSFLNSVVTTKPGDLNGNGTVSIGDLAMLAKEYGKDSTDPDWERIKHMDFNGDGKIDIADLALLARMILEDV
ncbi:alpha-L-fucosidase [Paenibacillus planticolens]|uniref:alpha-L-fucosidase n=1 Tax=Paenibacillus planticolens TaxID=2654976 RepID=A0ABX1ZKW5_9BACL|nr:alpha-L-fucosidase [Paenibacillus planticolens]NOV00732.1 carbohydrate-binding protein [Paenibacillus planticolens]